MNDERIREIDMFDYLPPYLQKYAELKQIISNDNIEFQDIENMHWKLVDNRFFTTCDIDGISRFEKLLGITPLQDDTLESRRFRVLAKWNSTIPYNYQSLKDKIESLCGKDNYIFIVDIPKQTVIVKIGLSQKNQYDSCAEIIHDVVPCNMICDVDLLYNKQSMLQHYKHGQLETYTYGQLRNEVLE